jgi:hypothetical protein
VRFNISQLKLHHQCAQKSHYRDIQKRGPVEKSEPLTLGTLWHKAMADLMTGSETLPPERAMAPEEIQKKWDETLAPLVPLVVDMLPRGYKVLAVEQPLSVPIGPHWLEGTPDLLITWNGKIWHVQYKTLNPSTPLHIYTETQRVDWHESGYEAMICHNYDDPPVGGTILIVARKLSAKSIAEKPGQAVSVHYLVRRPAEVAEALADMYTEMEAIYKEGPKGEYNRIQKNPGACGGVYGNQLCPYFHVCYGGKSILDFPIIPDRYTQEAK